MSFFSRVMLCAVALLALSGVQCGRRLHIKNSVPRVATVGPVTDLGGDRVEIRFSLQDHESDPIDVDLSVVDEQGTEVALVPGIGGHGTNGLSSKPTVEGADHIFIWDISELTLSGPLRLRIVPRDQDVEGLAYLSEPFTIETGIPERIVLPIELPLLD
ncbi:MAG: hypothetical protein KC609_14120 [Myxococcales bacterium]|nr:hypothetical protein [Myxococcales bacterium]